MKLEQERRALLYVTEGVYTKALRKRHKSPFCDNFCRFAVKAEKLLNMAEDTDLPAEKRGSAYDAFHMILGELMVNRLDVIDNK